MRLLILAALLGAVAAFEGDALKVADADPSSPFAITKTANPSPVASGQELTYTIEVTNTGGPKIDNVVLTDQINGLGGIGSPPQFVLTSTVGTCSQSVNLVTCSAGSLNGGQSWTVTIRGIVTASSGTTLNNTASVTGTHAAQNFTSTATVQTLVNGGGGGGDFPDLTINKTGPTSVTELTEFQYTLTVNNLGTQNATGISVVDTVPAGVTGISASGTSLFNCGVAGQTATCTGGQVNQGANATITISGTAPAAPATLTNTASVDPDNTIEETNELNNTSAIVNTEVVAGGTPGALTIDKSDSPDPVVPGTNLTYTLVITNTGSGPQSRATDVTVVDGTQGLEAASIAGTVIQTAPTDVAGTCVVAAPEVICEPSSPQNRLDGGETLRIEIVGQVVDSAGSTIINTATVTGNIKNVGHSATDTELTTVMPGVDLTITKADSPDPVCARSWPTPGHLANPPDGLAPAGGVVPALLASPVCLGGLTYTFSVGNSGINEATDVVVRDPLPAGLLFDSYETDGGFGCAVDGSNVVTCTGGTIPAQSTRTITFLLAAPPNTGSITNTVTVDPNNAIFEADETNNTFTQATQVSTGIDLVIRKDDSPVDPPGAQNVTEGFDPIATSGTQVYTITVDNVGTQNATGITVLDILPSNTVFLSTEEDHGFTCTYQVAPHTVECTGGSLLGTASEFYDPAGPAGPVLGADDFATIKIRIFAQPNVGTMTNEVRVDPGNTIAEVNESNNIEFESTQVVNGDGTIGAFNELSIDKQQTNPAGGTVSTSSVVTYTVEITNSGTDPAVGVKMRDILPAGFVYIEAADTAPGANAFLCSEAGNVINCGGATIPAGGSRTIQITAFASATPGTYTNQAIVDPDGEIPEGNETNNADSVQTTVVVGAGFIDLTIDKTGPATVTPGGLVNYSLTVSNLGTNPAFQVKVRDDLPEGTTYVSAFDALGGDGAFSCSHSGSVVTCTGGTLDGSAGLIPGLPTSRVINVTVRAPLEHGITITNQSFVDPDNAIPESNEINNANSHDTNVVSQINLTIAKAGPSTAQQNNTDSYKLTVSNEGTAPATNVEVIDPLPVGLIPLNVTADGNFTCQILENPVNVVSCVGDLEAGGEAEITIQVFITAQNGTTLDNEACVDPDNDIVESNEADNCSTHSLVVGVPDLSINKSADLGVVSPGDTLTYTVTVANVGDAPAVGTVTITDTLPSEVTLVNVTATNGFVCTGDPVITCTKDGLAVGGNTLITIQTTVNAGVELPFTNTAQVAAATDEVNLANNGPVEVTTSAQGVGVDLLIADVNDLPDPTPRGDSVTYTILAANAGSEDVTGVVIRDVFDSNTGLTVASATASQGFACDDDLSDMTIECTGDLQAGHSTTIEIVIQTSDTSPAALGSTITIDPDNTIPETDETNNSATEVTTISGAICDTCIDLVLSGISESAEQVEVGDTLRYTITVGNIGDLSTDTTGSPDVLVFFDLAASGGAEFNFVSYTETAGFSCSPFSNTSTLLQSDCVGDLGPGQGTIITIEVVVTAAGTITAEATADPNNTISEFSETNNGPVFESTTVVDP